MHKKIMGAGIILLLGIPAFCQPYFSPRKTIFNKDSIAAFPVQSVRGHATHVSFPVKQLLVIVFLSPECPICRNYSGKLVNLKNKYINQAAFIGIIPGSFSTGDVSAFQENYLPSWDLFSDKSLLLTHYLEGKVTPEVLVINIKSGGLLYKGAIDDWMVSLGKMRNHVSNFYLNTAVNNFLNKKPGIPYTKPVGCLINDF